MELFPPRTKSTKRPLEDTDDIDLQESKRPHLETTYVRRAYYRQPKPPYTYLGMMTVAITTSPTKRLTLSAIQDALQDMFPFFRGEYAGWRDSVRHILSSSPCFIKINRTHTTKGSKGNFWAVDLTLVPADAFKRLKVKPEVDGVWAPTLTEQLQIPDITLSTPRAPTRRLRKGVANATSSTDYSVHDPWYPATSPSLSYTQAQYTRYLREQTPSDTQVNLSQYPPFASLLYQTTTSIDYTEAASNLNRLCPEIEYGSPTPAARNWSTQSSTPRVRQQLQFGTPETSHAATQSTSSDSDNTAPLSDVAAFFVNFGNSLSGSETKVQHTDVQQKVHMQHEVTTLDYQNLTSTMNVHQTSPLTIKQEKTTVLGLQARTCHPLVSTPVTNPTHATYTQAGQRETPTAGSPQCTVTRKIDLPVLSFDDLRLSPDGAYNYLLA